MSLTIATVLKLGGPHYDVSYVNHIANSIKEHVTVPYEFVCLTDETAGFSTNVHKIIGLNIDGTNGGVNLNYLNPINSLPTGYFTWIWTQLLLITLMIL